MSTQVLTVRIAADASGAISVISQATERVNQFNAAGNSAAQGGVASLTGGVQNLGRWTATSVQAMASLTGGVSGLSRTTLDAANSTTRLNRELAENTRVANAAADANQQLHNSTSLLSSSLKILGGVFATLGLAQFAKEIVMVNAEFQSIRTSLSTVVGGADNAKAVFSEISKFAASTPYEIKDVTKAYIQMRTEGIAPSMEMMTSLGNTASARGVQISQLVAAVGDATRGQFERLLDAFGVAAEKTGNKIKFTYKSVETEVEDSSTAIQSYLKRIGDTDFASGMVAQSATIKGALSNLVDAWDGLLDHILDSNKENAIGKWVTTAASFLQDFDVWINGAVTNAQKLNQINIQIGQVKQSIQDHQNGGFFRQFYDGITGFDVNKELNKIDSLKKAQSKTLAEMAAEKSKTKPLFEADPVSVKAEADRRAKAAADAEEKFNAQFGSKEDKYKLELKKQTEALGRELTERQKMMVHDQVFASEIHASESATKKAAHKEETSAMRAAKKEQQDYQHLIESTPYGEYNASIDKLTAGLKRGGEEFRATYSTGIEEANKKLLDGTQYVKNHTEALKEQQRAFEQTPRGKFEKSSDELRAQKPFMTQSDYANKQDKIGVDYLHETGQNKEAKTQIDLVSESEKLLNAQLEKSKELLRGIKDTGAGAFDGLLGGISAVSSAFTSMGESLSNIAIQQEENLKRYTDYLNSQGTTQEGITKSTADFYNTKDALDEKSRAAEMSGIRQIAGASSKMFAEQSAGRKIMHTLEMTFGAIEMALSAKKIVMNGIEAITNQGKGDPYTAFGRMAAMAAVVAALGVGIAASVSGGSNQTSYSGAYADMSPTKSTGTVLGDNSANSKSIKAVTDVLNDIHAKEYPELKGINDSMKEFGKTIVNFVTGVAKATNSFTDMTFGVTQLEQPKNTMANMPFIGSLFTKTTVEKIGEGMIIAAFNPLEEGMKLGLQSYSTFKITKKGLFGSSTKIQEIYGNVPAAIESELTDLFGYMGKTVMNSLVSMDLVKFLGVSLPNFQIGTQKWDWLKSDNKQDYFNNMINATADRVAAVSQFIIGDFQKLGEGLYETLNRMAIQQGVVINKYRKMGLEFDSLVTTLDDGTTIGSLGMAALSDSLVNMYNSSADAKDGLKNFIAAMDSLYNLTTSKGAKSQNAIKGIESYFKDEGFDQAKMFDKSYIQSQIDKKQAEIKAAQEDAANKYQDVAKYGDYVGNAFTPKTDVDLSGLNSVFKKILGTSDYSSFTWDKVGGGFTEASIKAMAGVNQMWDDIILVGDSNRKKQAEGLAGLGGTYGSKEEFDAAKKSAQDVLDTANAKVTKLTDTISVFDEQLNKTIPKVTDIQNSYLDMIENHTSATARKRSAILDAEFSGMTVDLSAQTALKPIIDAMKKAGYQSIITAADIQKFTWAQEDLKAYSNKQKSLTQELFALTATDSEKAANDLALKIQDLKDNFIEVKDATGNVLNPLQNLIDLTTQIADVKKYKDSISAVNTFSDSLKKFRQTLITGDLSTFSPIQKYKANQSAMNSAYQTIMGGEGTTTQSKNAYDRAIANFQGYAEAYLNQSKLMYASGENYQKDFSMVLSEIDSVTRLQDAKATDAQKQLDALTAQTSLLTTQTSLLGSIDTSLKTFSAPTSSPVSSGMSLPAFIPVAQTTNSNNNNNNSSISEEIILELKALREEVAKLRAENAQQTGDIIKSNYDANAQAADAVNEGTKQTVTKNAFANKNKVVLS